MAKRSVITNKGLQLLASSSEATGQYWWIGYYALAYVPNIWKDDEVDIPAHPEDCDNFNGTPNIEEDDTDQIDPTMTHLTKNGDMVYNIFQGTLKGTGFYDCISDGSVGGNLFGISMYSRSIKKHYRYVMDKNGNNTLVTWVVDPDDESKLIGKYVYLGTDGFVKSTMPIPAPLYYLGNTGNQHVADYFPDYTDEEISGSNIYPYIDLELKPVEPAPPEEVTFPTVSVDYRGYTDSQGHNRTYCYGTSENPTNNGSGVSRTAGGQYFDSLEIPAGISGSNFDDTSWFASDLTFMPDYSEEDDSTICKEFWKLLSISNYNRFHSPVSSVGLILDSDLSSRNLAKVTKLFPISNYKVINTESGTNSNDEIVEVATAISVSIDIDLAPDTKEDNAIEDAYFLDPAKGEIQTVQDYPETENNPIEFENEENVPDQNDRNIFNTSHISFKFNRIGIYAVPLRKCPLIKDETDPSGKNIIVQFEIDPDTEPVLFAAVDWDNTVTLSEIGDGLHNFRAELNINLESSASNLDSELIRYSTIFYNLYEDDAIIWYKNQLVATASTQNAITELGLELAHIKNNQSSGCCPVPDLSGKYAAINHVHDGLKNLRDGTALGSVRGINTSIEGTDITVEGNTVEYLMGPNSTVLGGEGNFIYNTEGSFIGGGIDNNIYYSIYSSILNGNENIIGGTAEESLAHNSTILGGEVNKIGKGPNNSILGGEYNIIENADDCSILNGMGNQIGDNDLANTVYATVMGKDAAAYNYGEFSQSAGKFSFVGDAQRTHLIFRRALTTGSSWYNLALNGSAEYFDLTKKFDEKYGSFSGITKISGLMAPRTLTVSTLIRLAHDPIVTVTTTVTHNLVTGQHIILTGVPVGEFNYNNISYEITSLGGSSFTFSIEESIDDPDSLSGGTITTYPSSWLSIYAFTGCIDASGTTHLTQINTELIDTIVTTGDFNPAWADPPVIDIVNDELLIKAKQLSFAAVNWVADVDMIEIGIEPS